MIFNKSYLGIMLLALLMPTQVTAERVPLSPEALKAEATHIVTGLVKAVYGLDKLSTSYGEGTIETDYLLEIEVQTVEKGEGLKPGDLLYVRSWKVKKPGVRRIPGPYGHFIIPAKGERIRAFVVYGRYAPTAQSDNGWVVVYPNGIEKLERPEGATSVQTPTETQFPMSEPGFRSYWWSLLIGLAGGIVVALPVQWIFTRIGKKGVTLPKES
jgi:hypothetical protein